MNNTINKLEIAILIVLVSISTFSTNLYIPALPAMVILFHTNSASIQQSLVSFTYGFALCMLLSGVLADAFGRKKTVLVGLLIYAATSFAILFCHHLDELILLRFLQGLGGCCGTVVARVMVRDQFDDKFAVGILALLSSGMAVAFIVGPIVGSFLVHFFSWHACFILMFLIGVVMSLCVLFVLKSEKKTVSAAKKINWKITRSKYQFALQSRTFLIHTFAIAISWSGFFLIVMEYPFIMMTQLKCSVVHFGVIFSIILLGYLVGSRIARQLSVRGVTSDQSVMIGIMIMCFAGFIALMDIISMSEFILTLSGFIYLLGMGIQIPNSQFAAIPAQEKASATMTSLLYFIEMLTVALLSDFFKAHFAINGVTLWCALLFVMTLLLILFFFIKRVQILTLPHRMQSS